MHAVKQSQNKLNIGSLVKRPIDDSSFSDIWKGKTGKIDLPSSIIETLQILFDLQDGVEHVSSTVYGPGTLDLAKSGIEVAARILINCGGSDAYILSVTKGKTHGQETVTLKAGEALMFPFGYPAAFDINISNKSVAGPPRPGWRPRIIKPSKTRHTIVVDFKVNSKTLAKIINTESQAMANRHAGVSSNPLTAEEIKAKTADLFASINDNGST